MSAITDSQRTAWTNLEEKYQDSPVHRALGLTLAVTAPGAVTIHYDGNVNAQNRRGNAAGGALTEMIDSAVVQACRTLVEEADGLVTLELKVNFVRAGAPGAALVTHARIDYLGRSTAVGTARIETLDGELTALGTVTVSIKRAKT